MTNRASKLQKTIGQRSYSHEKNKGEAVSTSNHASRMANESDTANKQKRNAIGQQNDTATKNKTKTIRQRNNINCNMEYRTSTPD